MKFAEPGMLGKRGGTSATAGRKAETIAATVDNVTYSKRVYFGQRALTIIHSLDREGPLVQAWVDLPAARAYVERVTGSGPLSSSYLSAIAVNAEVVS